MATFTEHPNSSVPNYFRKKAIDLGCNPCFDEKIEDLMFMNEKGNEKAPSCLCHIGVSCPCKKWEKDSVTAEPGTMCYCEVFKKV